MKWIITAEVEAEDGISVIEIIRQLQTHAPALHNINKMAVTGIVRCKERT